MPIAVTMHLDAASAASVREIWRVLAESGIDSDRHRLGYAPHITLATYADDVAACLIAQAVRKLAKQWEPAPVKLIALGIFPGTRSVLWIVPTVSRLLLERHAELQAALPGVQPSFHYQPGQWVPHVTISGPLVDPTLGVSKLAPMWQPIEGWLEQIEIVRFRPIQVLESFQLLRHRSK